MIARIPIQTPPMCEKSSRGIYLYETRCSRVSRAFTENEPELPFFRRLLRAQEGRLVNVRSRLDVQAHSESSLTASPLPLDTLCGEAFLFRKGNREDGKRPLGGRPFRSPPSVGLQHICSSAPRPHPKCVLLLLADTPYMLNHLEGILFYAVFFADFGDREHVFMPVRRCCAATSQHKSDRHASHEDGCGDNGMRSLLSRPRKES